MNIEKLGKNYTQTIKKLEQENITTIEEFVGYEEKTEELCRKIQAGRGTITNMMTKAKELLQKEKDKKKIDGLKLPDPQMINKPTTWSVSDIWTKLSDNTLTVPTDFQRKEFWPTEQKQDLIDSLAVGLTIPPIYVYWNKEKGCWEIIDGQQRCTSFRDLMNNELPFMFTSTQAIEKELNVLNGFILQDVYERNQKMYNQLVSRQIDVVELSGISREEVQDFYITLNASNSEMSNGELYYAIRGAFHNVLLKIRDHKIFSNIQRSPRRGDLEAVTSLLYMKYNEGFALKNYERPKTKTLSQFRKISYTAADELLTNFTSDLDWCYDIMCHINYGNSVGATVNLISVLLSIRADNPDLDSEKMIRCLDYIYSNLGKSMLYPIGFEGDFQKLSERYTNSSKTAITESWKAIERIFSKGESIWSNQKKNIFQELMKN